MSQPFLKLAHYLFYCSKFRVQHVANSMFAVARAVENGNMEVWKAAHPHDWNRCLVDAISLTDDSVWDVAFPMTNTGDVFTTCDGKNMFYVRHGIVALKPEHLNKALDCGWTLERETETMVIVSRTQAQAAQYISTVHPDDHPELVTAGEGQRVYGDDYD